MISFIVLLGSKGAWSNFESVESSQVCLMISILLAIHIKMDLYSHFLALILSAICSIAGGPALEEWTARAEMCDSLHEPVDSYSHPCFNSGFSLSTCFFLFLTLFSYMPLIGSYCHGWKVYGPFRFLPFCVEGTTRQQIKILLL